MPIPFNGQVLVEPQVASFINDSLLQAPGSVSSGIVAVLGVSAMGGGQAPKTPILLTNGQTGRRYFATGTLPDGIDRAFSHGAGQVYALRVNPALPSQVALPDAGATACLNLLTTDYGAYTTSVRVKVDAGTIQGLKLTIQTPTVGPNTGTTIVGDNLYAAVIALTYTGTGTVPTYSVTATALTTSVTSDPTAVVTLPFATYQTIQALADALNATGKWSATVQGGATVGGQASATLDGATAVSVAAPASVTANRSAVLTFVNGPTGGNILTASVGALGSLPAATSVGAPATGAGYVALAGGTDGTTANSDWTNALAALQSVNADLVTVMSGDPAIHAAAQAHADYMSTTGHKERLAVVGGYLGETLTTANGGIVASKSVAARTSAINDPNVVLVWPGIYDYDWQGTIAYRDPFYAAACVAGLLAGGNVTDAATHKYLRVQGLELLAGLPINVATISQALQQGVCCLEVAQTLSTSGFRVAQSITTWQNDNNYARREASVVRGKYFVARTVREALASLIGVTSSPALAGQSIATMNDILTQMTSSGILVGGPGNPAFKNVTAVINADVLRASYQCSIGIPCNYILVTESLQPFSG